MYAQGSIYWKIIPTPRGRKKYQPMSFGGKNMKSGSERGGKCKRQKKEERGNKKEEWGKKKRKGEVKSKVNAK
jgi:hypothetical protein